MNKILIYGYGNPGRQDDALGILFADMISEWVKMNNFPNISTDSNYQLNIEDAYNLNNYDIVIFADASTDKIDDYQFCEIKPSLDVNFTMHSVSPMFIAGLCNEISGKTPLCYLLHIKGYKWNFMADLSAKAKANLIIAFNYATQKIKQLQNISIKPVKTELKPKF